MERFEYFSGVPEVGIVPRAPHAGPLMRHVYEQEHGRGGFAGKVSHTYRLSQPGYMATWSGYTTEPWFLHDPGRLAKERGEAERLANARDTLRPEASEEQDSRR